MKFEYSDEVFEQIIRVMKNITGECWYDIFGVNAKLIGGNSESEKLLDEYYDSHPPEIMEMGPLYTPHLLEWLIKKEGRGMRLTEEEEAFFDTYSDYDKLDNMLTKCLEGDMDLAYDLIKAIDKIHQRREFDDAQIRYMVSDITRRQSQ